MNNSRTKNGGSTKGNMLSRMVRKKGLKKKKESSGSADSNGVAEGGSRDSIPKTVKKQMAKYMPAPKDLPNGNLKATGKKISTKSASSTSINSRESFGGDSSTADGSITGDSFSHNSLEEQVEDEEDSSYDSLPYLCVYCSIHFKTEEELEIHYRSDRHQTTIMSDEGREWKYRPPPRLHQTDEYKLCHSVGDASSGTSMTCRMGMQCVNAHSVLELEEWKERFNYRATKLQEAKEKKMHGSSYADQLLDKLTTSNQHFLISCKTEGIISMKPPPSMKISKKSSSHTWTMTITPHEPLKVVSLLHDTNRDHFSIQSVSRVTVNPEDPEEKVVKTLMLDDYDKKLKDSGLAQEWVNPHFNEEKENLAMNKNFQTLYNVCVKFKSDIYGTFKQALVFDFGYNPVTMQKLCVDVIPVDQAEDADKNEIIFCESERWCEETVKIVHYSEDKIVESRKETPYSPSDFNVLDKYPAPTPSTFDIHTKSMDKPLATENYRQRFHDLLMAEELAQFMLMGKFNIKTRILATKSFITNPTTASVAKFALPGELYGTLELSSNISEDSPHGRLILTNCNSIFISKPQDTESLDKEEKRIVYEAPIEDKTRNEIYLKLSSHMVKKLNIVEDEELLLEVQFQLNRLPLAEMHFAIDRMTQLQLLFHDPNVKVTIPQNPNLLQYADNKLNPKQREAVTAITVQTKKALPPVLIIGPFGTGKTFTLAQALKVLVHQEKNRVLICTHSNSAADLYIKEYLHPYVMAGVKQAKPLRIYYTGRNVNTSHADVQRYSLMERSPTDGLNKFRMPTKEEVLQHKVIVTTLNTSRSIMDLGIERGYFTHILIDEAAQAMECAAIIPLVLAGPSTRVVLAGDYMQLSPEVFSPFCEDKGLGVSLLERLYDSYPSDHPCRILLLENYRSHPSIIKYTSDLFYEGKLLASGNLTAHPKFKPLTFFTAKGEDVQDCSATAFHNNSEIYETVERVHEIIKTWPKEWGPINDTSIGVVTPYNDQVVRIRTELRRRRMNKVCVERVLNVQGKQFRVVLLSTVRTSHTCSNDESGLDYGFLSNAKLLTTAITRAQSLVAVVGDPVSLLTIGKCRKLWETFIDACYMNGSLYGIAYKGLKSQLDGVEFKKTFELNPLAPEFVPRAMRNNEQQKTGYTQQPSENKEMQSMNETSGAVIPYDHQHAENTTRHIQQNPQQIQPIQQSAIIYQNMPSAFTAPQATFTNFAQMPATIQPASQLPFVSPQVQPRLPLPQNFVRVFKPPMINTADSTLSTMYTGPPAAIGGAFGIVNPAPTISANPWSQQTGTTQAVVSNNSSVTPSTGNSSQQQILLPDDVFRQGQQQQQRMATPALRLLPGTAVQPYVVAAAPKVANAAFLQQPAAASVIAAPINPQQQLMLHQQQLQLMYRQQQQQQQQKLELQQQLHQQNLPTQDQQQAVMFVPNNGTQTPANLFAAVPNTSSQTPVNNLFVAMPNSSQAAGGNNLFSSQVTGNNIFANPVQTTVSNLLLAMPNTVQTTGNNVFVAMPNKDMNVQCSNSNLYNTPSQITNLDQSDKGNTNIAGWPNNQQQTISNFEIQQMLAGNQQRQQLLQQKLAVEKANSGGGHFFANSLQKIATDGNNCFNNGVGNTSGITWPNSNVQSNSIDGLNSTALGQGIGNSGKMYSAREADAMQQRMPNISKNMNYKMNEQAMPSYAGMVLGNNATGHSMESRQAEMSKDSGAMSMSKMQEMGAELSQRTGQPLYMRSRRAVTEQENAGTNLLRSLQGLQVNQTAKWPQQNPSNDNNSFFSSNSNLFTNPSSSNSSTQSFFNSSSSPNIVSNNQLPNTMFDQTANQENQFGSSILKNSLGPNSKYIEEQHKNQGPSYSNTWNQQQQSSESSSAFSRLSSLNDFGSLLGNYSSAGGNSPATRGLAASQSEGDRTYAGVLKRLADSRNN